MSWLLALWMGHYRPQKPDYIHFGCPRGGEKFPTYRIADAVIAMTLATVRTSRFRWKGRLCSQNSLDRGVLVFSDDFRCLIAIKNGHLYLKNIDRQGHASEPPSWNYLHPLILDDTGALPLPPSVTLRLLLVHSRRRLPGTRASSQTKARFSG